MFWRLAAAAARHHAATLNCAMTFSIFLPPTQDNEPPGTVPVVRVDPAMMRIFASPKQARSVSQQNWVLYW
ncbi:hypothetical protein KCP69_12020 [Salmonella enterica subsp. enterica]|nr:hypothetical protein KCP69_12020 [Salmonella enterica subsp. enterica]